MKNIKYLSKDRHATWLELFFDLIFAVALGRVTHLLAHTHKNHLELENVFMFFALFVPFWWIWVCHTIYANRFDDDSKNQRFMTIILMFVLMMISGIFNEDISSSYKLAISMYIMARVIQIVMYVKVLKNDKATAVNYIKVFSLGIAIVSASLFFSAKFSIILLLVSIICEIILIPILRDKGSKKIDRDHLIERTGLLALILLGESIISLISGLSGLQLNSEVVFTSLIGFSIVFMIWWIYFDSFNLLLKSEHDKHGIVILYSQLLTYMSFAILANVIRHAILNDLVINEFRYLTVLGILLFYLGKQIPYYVCIPEYRKYNIRNTFITLTAVSLSLFFNDPKNILLGMAISLIVYIALNYQSQLKIYGRASF